MKRRYIYSILFGVPGLVVALIAAVMVFAATAGVLWIFVYGDNPWPRAVETVLPIFFFAVLLGVWVTIIAAGYYIGKRREQDAALNKTHVLMSVGATLLFIVAVAVYELGVGNIALR